jgi:hypothetical protein
VVALAQPSDGDPQSDAIEPRSVICTARRAWVIVPAASSAQQATYGRTRRLIAVDRKAALVLYEGPPCNA